VLDTEDIEEHTDEAARRGLGTRMGDDAPSQDSRELPASLREPPPQAEDPRRGPPPARQGRAPALEEDAAAGARPTDTGRASAGAWVGEGREAVERGRRGQARETAPSPSVVTSRGRGTAARLLAAAATSEGMWASMWQATSLMTSSIAAAERKA